MTRRKYQFRSRAEAEAAYRTQAQTSVQAEKALMDVLNDGLHWLARRGAYRVALIGQWRSSGPTLVVCFAPGGQKAQYTLHNPHAWVDWVFARYPGALHDCEREHLLALAETLRGTLRAWGAAVA